MPGLVVPEMQGRQRRQPQPAQFLVHRHLGAERGQGLSQHRDAGRVPVVEVRGQAVEEQVGRPWAPMLWLRRGVGGAGHLRVHRRRDLPSARRTWRRTARRDRSPGTVARRRVPAARRPGLSSSGASPPRLVTQASWACMSSMRAWSSSLSGPADAIASRLRVASNAPAWNLVPAAASARTARRVGSGVSTVARSRNAAAAASPPRSRARPAERSSSSSTFALGPVGGVREVPRAAVLCRRLGRSARPTRGGPRGGPCAGARR